MIVLILFLFFLNVVCILEIATCQMVHLILCGHPSYCTVYFSHCAVYFYTILNLFLLSQVCLCYSLLVHKRTESSRQNWCRLLSSITKINEAKVKLRKLCQMSFREKFTPRNFLAIR